jgi:hypothetical protein
MGSVAEWKGVLESGAAFAVLTAVGDAFLRLVFRTRSSLLGSWTFSLIAGYFFRQALLGLWFGMAVTFGWRALHGLLAVVLFTSVAGWLVVVVWFARAVERQTASR